MKRQLLSLYQGIILHRPVQVLLGFLVLLIFLAQFIDNFRLDASSDSLTLENDQALDYYQRVVTQYESNDYLVLTYTPKGEDLFNDSVLADLTKLRDSLAELEEVDSLVTIIDVPLMQSPPVTLNQLSSQPNYLLDERANREQAKQEFKNSPLYRDFLVSDDLTTTAIIIQLKPDNRLRKLYESRKNLRKLKREAPLKEEVSAQLNLVATEYQQVYSDYQARQIRLISDVRSLMSDHKANASLFLGGVPMIVADSMSYIQSDLIIFGSAALIVIIMILALTFGQVVWVLIPLAICMITGFIMICLLGLFNWPVSIVSSNFLSLLLIVTLSLNIHLVVRYHELHNLESQASRRYLISETLKSKFKPCFYTAITTIVAFISLIVSGIRPVIDFGWMMCLGVFVALLVTFLLFPVLTLIIKPKVVRRSPKVTDKLLHIFSRSLTLGSVKIIVPFVSIILVCLYGLSQLTVENRFIDYFKADTEIYRGMHLIDEKLGGTTPLDLILDAPTEFLAKQENITKGDDLLPSDVSDNIESNDQEQGDLNDLDEFDELDEESDQVSLTASSYWYNKDGLAKLDKIHRALEAMPEIGKVSSIAMSINLIDSLKDSKPMGNVDLELLRLFMSPANKQLLFEPFLSEDGNQAHINIRVFESDKTLNRNRLINDIEKLLVNEFKLEPEQVNLSGMMVLYNNMLNSLFESQIMTLGVVFFAVFIMFLLFFRNIKLTLVAIVPNLFSAVFVIGLMGILSIPLDIMTITVAAISVGIAVDNTIHYIHRFQKEYVVYQDYSQALNGSIQSIGKAMLYTSIVITAGFLILVFSNFVPTVYFGLLTGLAMTSALIGDLVLLPFLIKKFKPI